MRIQRTVMHLVCFPDYSIHFLTDTLPSTIQSGPKKSIHSLLINIFGINLNDISISERLCHPLSKNYKSACAICWENIILHSHTEIEMSFKFIPKILMSKECIYFFGPVCIYYRQLGISHQKQCIFLFWFWILWLSPAKIQTYLRHSFNTIEVICLTTYSF